MRMKPFEAACYFIGGAAAVALIFETIRNIVVAIAAN